MSKSEYAELIEFLGRKFDRIDQRFEQIDRRFEQLEGEVRALGVLIEENRHRIELLAEKISFQGGKIDDLRREMSEGFGRVREEMRAGFDAVHQRVARLEAA